MDEQSRRLEDRFHRTVKITRLGDSRNWTGAADIASWYMNDLPAYLQRWLEDCFGLWGPNAIPEGFEIPQGEVRAGPAKHHCLNSRLLLSALTRAPTQTTLRL
jgi:hypothetical protein